MVKTLESRQLINSELASASKYDNLCYSQPNRLNVQQIQTSGSGKNMISNCKLSELMNTIIQ